MKTMLIIAGLVAAWAGVALAAGGGQSAPETPDGILALQPATATNCVAVRVDVPEDRMVTGVRWFNGSADEVFSRIMVTTGRGEFPPEVSTATDLATDVGGLHNAWTTLEFSAPVASQTGTLFLVFQYRPGYTPVAGAAVHGVGYVMEDSPASYFVSGDGADWHKVGGRCRLLVEPVLNARDFSVLALGAVGPGVEPDPPALPAAFAFTAYPNPFNPTVHFRILLPEGGPAEVAVFDIRGSLVRRLHHGPLAAGEVVLAWDGRDNNGRRLSSGAYWARVRTETDTITRRVVMLK